MPESDPAITTLAAKIDEAFRQTEHWFRGLPRFATLPRNASGSVTGFCGPTLLSEADCAFHYARHLQPLGVPWGDLHLELSRSEWLFAAGHPALTTPRWRADLVVARERVFLGATLPAAQDEYVFDAMFEFKRIGDGSDAGRADVEQDIAKVAERYMDTRITRLGYAVVLEDRPPVRNQLDAEWQARMAAAYPEVTLRILR